MKEAIEKAIKNGLFEVLEVQSFIQHGESYIFQFNNDLAESFTVYDLVFGTPLIDKLVGDGKEVKMCYDCDKPVKCEYDKYEDTDMVDCSTTQELCDLYKVSYVKDASYHRAQMANKKSIEELKEYVRGLI